MNGVKESFPDTPDAKDGHNLSSAETVLATLEYIGGSRSRKLSDIIAFLGRPKSTVLRLIDTLVRAGFVRRNGPGEYSVTIKLWRLGCQAVNDAERDALIVPAIKRMAIETGESSVYTIYENGFSVFVEKFDSPQPVAANIAIGSSAPAYATATGKAMLAYQPPAEIDRVLRAATSCTLRTIVDYASLQKELAAIRETQLAFNSGEWREEIAGAAAPIFNRHGDVIGAIGIASPRSRVEQRIEALGRIVQMTARELSRNLGARHAK